MNSLYDADIDFLEVIEVSNKTVARNFSDALTLFYSDNSTRRLVGFSLEAASEHLDELVHVPSQMRLAGLVRITRGILGLSQEELAKRVDLGMRTLQRFEAGEGNPTYEALLNIANIAPVGLDFSILLKRDKPNKVS